MIDWIAEIISRIRKMLTADPVWSEMRSADRYFSRGTQGHPFHRDQKRFTLRVGRGVGGFIFGSYPIGISGAHQRSPRLMKQGDRSEPVKDDLSQSDFGFEGKFLGIDRRPFRIEIRRGRGQ